MYDALIIPCGRAPECIRLNPRHGAQVLAAGVLAGKTCSCYPAVAPDVAAAGGIYAEIAINQAHACGTLVTAPAWPAQFLRVLGTHIEP